MFLLLLILSSIVIYVTYRIFLLTKRNLKELKLVHYILDQHERNLITWTQDDFYARRSHPFYVGKSSDLEMYLNIWSDKSCWITFKTSDNKYLTLDSQIYPEIYIIAKEIRERFKYKKPIDQVLSKLKIDKNIERDRKIDSILKDDSILNKVKSLFIK
jgi:hypothetical protein